MAAKPAGAVDKHLKLIDGMKVRQNLRARYLLLDQQQLRHLRLALAEITAPGFGFIVAHHVYAVGARKHAWNRQ